VVIQWKGENTGRRLEYKRMGGIEREKVGIKREGVNTEESAGVE
jgi:hypothetical protein